MTSKTFTASSVNTRLPDESLNCMSGRYQGSGWFLLVIFVTPVCYTCSGIRFALNHHSTRLQAMPVRCTISNKPSSASVKLVASGLASSPALLFNTRSRFKVLFALQKGLQVELQSQQHTPLSQYCLYHASCSSPAGFLLSAYKLLGPQQQQQIQKVGVQE